jgi:hypothetical protein
MRFIGHLREREGMYDVLLDISHRCPAKFHRCPTESIKAQQNAIDAQICIRARPTGLDPELALTVVYEFKALEPR